MLLAQKVPENKLILLAEVDRGAKSLGQLRPSSATAAARRLSLGPKVLAENEEAAAARSCHHAGLGRLRRPRRVWQLHRVQQVLRGVGKRVWRDLS